MIEKTTGGAADYSGTDFAPTDMPAFLVHSLGVEIVEIGSWRKREYIVGFLHDLNPFEKNAMQKT